ncbi:MAG: hypothetical protein HOL85_01170 [Rhodospirillaceae bacterium]|nr:hypothetical protein [Rhodospirillaceae bacterium]MBT6136438.1 hypothetical protein [Rhodospirillaceae bacterium]
MGRFKERWLDQQDRRRRATCLGDLTQAGVGVFCWCNRCGHSAEAATQMLISQLGPDFPVPEVGARMRCSACGSKDVSTRPAWPSRGQTARHH